MLPPPSRISRVGTPTTLRVGKQPLERAHGRAVPPFVVQRHHHITVRDIEVDIRGGHTIARPPRVRAGAHIDAGRLLGSHVERPRLMDLVDGEPPAARIARLAQPLEASLEIWYCGSLRSSVQVNATCPGLVKHASSSMCPPVSSRYTPAPSQITVLTPRYRHSLASIWARLRPGFRFGLRRHSSVVKHVPCPSTWMAPPSSTHDVRYRSSPSISSTFCATSSSRSQGKYSPPASPPQALNDQWTPRRRPLASTTNVGPQSRIQASSLDISTTRTRARGARARCEIARRTRRPSPARRARSLAQRRRRRLARVWRLRASYPSAPARASSNQNEARTPRASESRRGQESN